MRQVLLAFEAAWEKGIVHRDMKPSNVVIDRLVTPSPVAQHAE